MTRILLLAGALALASSAQAQSVPNVSGIKQTTNRAVAKTNAHTLAMTTADSATAAAPASGAARGASPAAKSRSATTRNRTVRATPAAAATTAEPTGKVLLRREVFAYDQGSRRDPFVSLMTVGELRPMISDLALVGILIDPTGRNSVAVLRDINSKEQYRVRVGQQIGRMRVARIAQKSVTFTIEEFGYSRQQELGLDDSNPVRTK